MEQLILYQQQCGMPETGKETAVCQTGYLEPTQISVVVHHDVTAMYI